LDLIASTVQVQASKSKRILTDLGGETHPKIFPQHLSKRTPTPTKIATHH
jgi:hypothetical protein